MWESWILDFAMNAFRMHSSPNLQGGRIQDSKFQTEFWKDSRFPKRILESKGVVGFKIQDSRSFFWALNLESWNLPPWIQDFFSEPWILKPTPLDSRFFFWALNLESWILPPWIQEVFSEPWILNLESYPLGFKNSFWNLESWILPPWIQEVFSEPWILNLESYPLGFKNSFWDLESWPFCTRLLRNSWILDLRFGEECILNAFFAKSSENRAKRTNKNIGSFKVKMHIHSMLETLLIPIKTSQN